MSDNIVSLTDLIEQRLRKQQEIDYYKETLQKLQIKISELVDTKDKDRKSISNECYEIIKNGIENNVN